MFILRQQLVVQRKNQELSRRYFGPFRILQKMNESAYKLKLPPNLEIHPVFHISLFKPYKGFAPHPSVDMQLDQIENYL